MTRSVTSMDIATIKKLNLARHLYELGKTCSRSANDIQLFSAVNLMQDAVEAFLLAVAGHVKADIKEYSKFNEYFDQINNKITPKELVFKDKLMRLNKVRVSSKHHGIQPARNEVEEFVLVVREFFDEVSKTILEASFSTISVIDLLKDGDTKKVLVEAKKSLESGSLEDCAVNCRKALYLEIERQYDISELINEDDVGLAGRLSQAPSYAKSKQYIDEHVCTPTDFIVYEHTSLNQDLITKGVDNTKYWNIWRLTPEVYYTKDKTWVVKGDFAKLNTDVLRDRIDYIFYSTLDVVLSIHLTKQAIRWTVPQTKLVELTKAPVPLYKKADNSSEKKDCIPKSVKKVNVDYKIEGLKGSESYWHVFHREESHLLEGFIHQDCVKTETPKQ